MKRTRSNNFARSCHGATFIEATISVLVFLSVIFVIIDLSRYLFTVLMLNSALQAGVDVASKLELETPTTQSDCWNAANCAQYLNRFDTVVTRVRELADTVTLPSSADGGTRRRRFRHYYQAPQDQFTVARPAGVISDVAFLRPGEIVCELPDNQTDTCAPNSPTYEVPARTFTQGWPAVNENWPMVLRSNPFALRLTAEFDFVTPLLPDMTIRLVQFGHRYAKTGTRAFAAVPIPPGNPPHAPPPPPHPVGINPPPPPFDCSCCDPSPNGACTGDLCWDNGCASGGS